MDPRRDAQDPVINVANDYWSNYADGVPLCQGLKRILHPTISPILASVKIIGYPPAQMCAVCH